MKKKMKSTKKLTKWKIVKYMFRKKNFYKAENLILDLICANYNFNFQIDIAGEFDD
jgi:DNA-binding transcriptional regulator GbsR (MarR family)